MYAQILQRIPKYRVIDNLNACELIIFAMFFVSFIVGVQF